MRATRLRQLRHLRDRWEDLHAFLRSHSRHVYTFALSMYLGLACSDDSFAGPHAVACLVAGGSVILIYGLVGLAAWTTVRFYDWLIEREEDR